MPRAKGGPKTRRRHKRQLKLASGFVGGRKLDRQARNTLEKGLTYAYRDRKQKKRNFRALWVQRINALARELSVPPNRVSDIVNGKRSITADTALRLGKCFGGSPEFWLDLQADYDLRIAKRTTWHQAEPWIPGSRGVSRRGD